MEQEGFRGEWGRRGSGRGKDDSSGGSACGRNRMTERAHGTTGGDDCQNRAARRYEKCSYLWHYFRRFKPFFLPLLLPPTPGPCYCRRVSQIALSCPLFPLLPLSLNLHITPALNLPLRCPYRLVPQNARSSFLLPLLARSPARPPARPPRVSSFPRSRFTPLCTRSGAPPPAYRVRTAGRYCPHRRGHHFNVTLIKSNNQYLPRKKF